MTEESEILVPRTGFAQPPEGPRRRAPRPPRLPAKVINPPMMTPDEPPEEIGEPYVDPSPPTIASTSPPQPEPKATPSEIALGASAIVGTILSLGLTVVSLMRTKAGRSTLREPSSEEYDTVTEPLGRIFSRHSPVELASTATKDLLDFAVILGGIRRYISDPHRVEYAVTPMTRTEGTV